MKVSRLLKFKSKKNGTAWAGILIFLAFILTLGLAVVSESLNTALQTRKLAQIQTAQALCDAGVERAVWELNEGNFPDGIEDNSFETGDYEINVVGGSMIARMIDVEVTSYVPNRNSPKTTRTVKAKIINELNESSIGFDKAVQVGGQGVYVSNNSFLNGSVYSGGNVECQINGEIRGSIYVHNNNQTDSDFKDIIGCRRPGVVNAYALNILGNTLVGGEGWYVNNCQGTNCSSLQQVSLDQLKSKVGYEPLPISETEIARWKVWATRASNAYHYGDFVVSSTGNATIGPKVIVGNLIVNGGTLTLTGAVHVQGNITFATGSSIKLSETFGPNGGILIASPLGETDTGWVDIGSNVSIVGSGHSSSYLLVISESKRKTASPPAIYAGNNSGSVVYFAAEGMIRIRNGATVNAISGDGLYLDQNATLDFQDGLELGNFSGGPGRTWRLIEWQVVF